MTEHRYHWRSRDQAVLHNLRAALGQPGQVSLPVPGYRPDHGRCPGCRAPQDHYCFLGCPLIDPHALRHLDLLARCQRCSHLWWRQPADGGLGVLAGRRILHVPRSDDPAMALCSRSIQPLVPLNGATW